MAGGVVLAATWLLLVAVISASSGVSRSMDNGIRQRQRFTGDPGTLRLTQGRRGCRLKKFAD